jgi:hypothetical protein
MDTCDISFGAAGALYFGEDAAVHATRSILAARSPHRGARQGDCADRRDLCRGAAGEGGGGGFAFGAWPCLREAARLLAASLARDVMALE